MGPITGTETRPTPWPTAGMESNPTCDTVLVGMELGPPDDVRLLDSLAGTGEVLPE